MRWILIREAKIDREIREMFEQYGLTTMQLNLALGDYVEHKGKIHPIKNISSSLLPWLTEQYDRAERKESWSMIMEVAITILVAAELLILIFKHA
jgi:hypothetical protein